jgi:hypothetical protein
MAYIGNTPAESFASFEKQVFTIVNSQTAYTLSHSVTNENDIRLVVNNVVQEPGSGKAYTASGTTLTLSAALTNGTDTMYCVFLGRAIQTVNPPNASVGSAQVADSLISGKTALGATPADTDELLISDAGTLKRVDYSHLKSSNTPAFMVRLASNFTLTDQSTVKVNFDTEDFDTDTAFASNKFTVPSGKGGKYFISAQLGVSASGSVVHRSDIYIYVNGSKVATGTGFDSNNTQYSVFVNVALSLDLSASDYVEVYNYNDVSSGTPVARASDKQSYFTGFKIIE